MYRVVAIISNHFEKKWNCLSISTAKPLQELHNNINNLKVVYFRFTPKREHQCVPPGYVFPLAVLTPRRDNQCVPWLCSPPEGSISVFTLAVCSPSCVTPRREHQCVPPSCVFPLAVLTPRREHQCVLPDCALPLAVLTPRRENQCVSPGCVFPLAVLTPEGSISVFPLAVSFPWLCSPPKASISVFPLALVGGFIYVCTIVLGAWDLV